MCLFTLVGVSSEETVEPMVSVHFSVCVFVYICPCVSVCVYLPWSESVLSEQTEESMLVVHLYLCVCVRRWIPNPRLP